VRVIHDGTRRARIWFDADEIERITADTLRNAGLWPAADPRELDVERLLEVHLGATVDYAGDLDRDVLGYTLFEDPPHVVVSRTLTDLASGPSAGVGVRGRWRATLAHEAAHILFHASLYVAPRSRKRAAVRCFRSDIEAGGEARDWREVQANLGMAALLMPRDPFLAFAARILLASTDPVFPPLNAQSVRAGSLADALAMRFGTSRQAALIRLVTFGFVST
jgi:hypothetical protein